MASNRRSDIAPIRRTLDTTTDRPQSPVVRSKPQLVSSIEDPTVSTSDDALLAEAREVVKGRIDEVEEWIDEAPDSDARLARAQAAHTAESEGRERSTLLASLEAILAGQDED